jgi:hypothetical protein
MARLPFRFHYPAPRGQFRKEEKSHGTKETGQKAEEIEKARVHEDSYHNPQMVRQRRGRIIKARCLRVYDCPPGGGNSEERRNPNGNQESDEKTHEIEETLEDHIVDR